MSIFCLPKEPVLTLLSFTSVQLFSMLLTSVTICEMEYLWPYQSTRNVIAISDFRAPNVNESSPKQKTMPVIQQIPHPHGDCWGAGECKKQPSVSYWTGVNGGCKQLGNRIWPQIAEVHVKRMNSVSQRLASSHTPKNSKFLS